MTFYGIPRGPGGPGGGASLVSFGSSNQTPSAGDRLIFSGSGAVSAVPMNNPPQVLMAGMDAYDYVTEQDFAADKSGMANMPFQDSVVTWSYYVKASSGLSVVDTWTDLSDRLDQLYEWFWGSYDYTNADDSQTYTGAGGQKGDLIVLDSRGNARVAKAKWVSFPDKIQPGQVSYFMVDLTFHILSHFVALPY